MGNDKGFFRFRKMRTNLRRVMVIALIVFAEPTLAGCITGLAFVIAGQIIHFISAGYLVKKDELITAGPYRFVRNPFYVGSFLTDVGFSIASGNLIVPLIFFPVFYGIVIFGRTIREEDLLLGNFGSAYLEFMKKVPRFVPRLSPANIQANGRFSWLQIRRHRELSRSLRACTVWALFLFLFYYLDGFDSLLTAVSYIANDAISVDEGIALSVVIGLSVTAEIVKLGFEKKKNRDDGSVSGTERK